MEKARADVLSVCECILKHVDFITISITLALLQEQLFGYSHHPDCSLTEKVPWRGNLKMWYGFHHEKQRRWKWNAMHLPITFSSFNMKMNSVCLLALVFVSVCASHTPAKLSTLAATFIWMHERHYNMELLHGLQPVCVFLVPFKLY